MEKTKYNKYPTYKPSGVDWFGVIPEHWNYKRFKYISEIQKGKLPKKIVLDNEVNLPAYLSMEYLRGNEENQWVSDREAKVIEKDEILLLWDGSNAGEFLKSRKGVISSTVALINFKNILKSYAWYYSKFLEIELKQKTIGMGIPHVNGDILNNFLVLSPPFHEQEKIASFLDDKTARIDSLIAQKEKMIALLRERKQIIIQQVVTGKIVWNKEKNAWTKPAEVKDSRVEWIGDIPVGWEVKKLSYLANIDSGATPDRSRPSYWNGNIPWIKTGEVNYQTIFQAEEYITEIGLKNSATKIAPVGTLLMAMYGQGVTRGRVALLGISATYNQACCGIKFSEIINNFFGLYFFIAAYYYIRDDGNETSQMNISTGYISSLKIVVPPINEQQQIVTFIETQSTKIDKAIVIHEQQIQKLKEYKTVLVDSAVTGKIKVF